MRDERFSLRNTENCLKVSHLNLLIRSSDKYCKPSYDNCLLIGSSDILSMCFVELLIRMFLLRGQNICFMANYDQIVILSPALVMGHKVICSNCCYENIL